MGRQGRVGKLWKKRLTGSRLQTTNGKRERKKNARMRRREEEGIKTSRQ